MTPDEIRNKCRKVWIVTTDGRIFGNEPTDPNAEPRAVCAFRTEQIGTGCANDLHAAQYMAYNCDRWGNPKEPLKKYKAVPVYLVPASKIDTDKPQG